MIHGVMKIEISGIELDETKELEYNKEKLRLGLRQKLNFWTSFKEVIKGRREGGGKAGVFFRAIVFLGVLPNYIHFLINGSQRKRLINEAEEELSAHYQKPENQVRRFRLQCELEKDQHQQELKVIEEELRVQRQNLQMDTLAQQTKGEIEALIVEFEEKQQKKAQRIDFYEKCEERLLAIEQQIKIKDSIKQSKEKLALLDEEGVEAKQQEAVEEELELFQYYGKLLSDLSTNLEKVKSDKEEVIETLELKAMLPEVRQR